MTETTSPQTKKGLTLIELEQQIHGVLAEIEGLKEKVKTQKEMFDAAFENDAEYSQAMEKEKAIRKTKAGIKQRIVKQPAVSAAMERIKELKAEMKDEEFSLSGVLQQYQEVSGTNQIVRDDGEVLEIVKVMKVVRKSARG